MRFLALLSFLFLSACSYDPYHYYYDCEGTNRSGAKGTQTFYAHNETVIDGKFQRIYRLEKETSVNKSYSSYQTFETGDTWKYIVTINKISHKIDDDVRNEKGGLMVANNFECNVTKTIFPK